MLHEQKKEIQFNSMWVNVNLVPRFLFSSVLNLCCRYHFIMFVWCCVNNNTMLLLPSSENKMKGEKYIAYFICVKIQINYFSSFFYEYVHFHVMFARNSDRDCVRYFISLIYRHLFFKFLSILVDVLEIHGCPWPQFRFFFFFMKLELPNSSSLQLMLGSSCRASSDPRGRKRSFYF